MSSYKVIQDIEAEDKLVGPFSLRQFLYLLITLAFLFVAYQMARVQIALALPFLPPAIIFGFLSAPLSRDQPSEIWLLSRIQFFLKPKVRIWDQSGLKQLVVVTAPKKQELPRYENISQNEVRSKLQALADTIDSRGWATKNVNVNLFAQPNYLLNQNNDRLVDASSIPQEVPAIDIQAADDMLDMQNNPLAQQLTYMVNQAAQQHRAQAIEHMHQAAQPASEQPATGTWFMPPQSPTGGLPIHPDPTVFMPGMQPVSPITNVTPSAEELAIAQKLQAEKQYAQLPNSNLKTIKPLSEQQPQPTNSPAASATSTSRPTANPAILELAKNDDFDVATIARQAKMAEAKESGSNEVIVSLR